MKRRPSNEIEKYQQKLYKTKNVTKLIGFGIASLIFWFLALYFTWYFFEFLQPAVRLERFGDFLLAVTFILAGLVALAGVVDVGSDMISDFLKRRALLRHAKEEKII